MYQKQESTRSSFAVTAAGIASLYNAGVYSDDRLTESLQVLEITYEKLRDRHSHYFFWYGNYVFVNQEGQRFTNEAAHYSIVYNDAAYKAPGGAFMVFDSSEAFAPYVQAAETALDDPALFKADTVEELAAAMGVDAANLKSTLDAYGKGDDPFGKPAARSTPISVGPFYAVRYYPSSMGTFGGVKVGEDLGVLDASGTPIPGLYAAGEMANRPYYAQVYMSGSALQLAASTGQTAGKAAAQHAAS